MHYKISELASYIDVEKCTSTGARNFASETWRDEVATIKQIQFWNKLPKKSDAPFKMIDINSLSKPEVLTAHIDEPMITVPVKWLEKVICQK